jgi:hypothetical protein
MRLEGDPTGGPAELHIFNKENSPLAIAMRKSLGLNTTEEAAAASEKIMQELLEIEPQETPQTPEFDPMKTFIPMRRRMDPQLDEKTREALKKYGARE